MARADHVEFNGVVTDCIAGSKFKVTLDNGKELMCTISGKLRMNMIKILKGDKVTVEVSPYDVTRGIISWRSNK